MIGEDSEVPPTWSQPPWLSVLKIAAPVFGSASADTSLSSRLLHPVTEVCQEGLGDKAEQPPPEDDHGVSVQPRELLAVFSVVPPTEVTNWASAGNSGPGLSPAETVIATPGWLKKLLASVASVEYSAPPQLLEMNLAPRATAEFSAVYRLVSLALFASTSVMWHSGQIADTMSMSSASSTSQPEVPAPAGSGEVAPFWFTLVKQPAPQAGRPHCDR